MRIMLANFTAMVNDSGGLSKVTCSFANAMSKRGHDVTVVYSDDKKGDFFFPVDKTVKCYNLRHYEGNDFKYPVTYKIVRELVRPLSKTYAKSVNNYFVSEHLLGNLQRILKNNMPDVIVSFQPAASKNFILDLKSDIPVITMSHGDPEDYFHNYPKKEQEAVKCSAACQVLMPHFVNAIKSRYPSTMVEVIGNVVPQYERQANLLRNKDEYKIIFIGQLVKTIKRPHLLIKAFVNLADKYPQWQLEIWGAENRKSYKAYLQKLIDNAHLNNRIFIKGITHDVESVLYNGDIIVLPSSGEGFGLAAAEGMSMGLPAVGYKRCTGLAGLIEDGKTGFLCDDGEKPLEEKLERLMSDRTLRVTMGNAAREAMKQYSSELIWKKWEELIRKVVTKK